MSRQYQTIKFAQPFYKLRLDRFTTIRTPFALQKHHVGEIVIILVPQQNRFMAQITGMERKTIGELSDSELILDIASPQSPYDNPETIATVRDQFLHLMTKFYRREFTNDSEIVVINLQHFQGGLPPA